MMIESVNGLIPKVYDILKLGDFELASKEIESIFQNDLENEQIIFTISGIKFWTDKFKRITSSFTAFECGEYLVSQWKPFILFMKKQNSNEESVISAIKQGVFFNALKFYNTLYKEEESTQDPELYRKLGLCYKFLGDYEKSLSFLELANEGSKESPTILAELADCYALCGEIRLTKVLFREAFFVGAGSIELCFLESEIIKRLISQVRALGYTGLELAEWIPVYGVLYGVLNIKRELRALEFGKLKQNIFALENEIKDASPESQSKLIPRLINHYFWLIDHYINVHEEQARINEILLKIKLLDTEVYNRYTM